VPRLLFNENGGRFNGTHHHRHHNLKPKKADYRVTDGGGLYIHILVSPNRSKLWRYDYRLGGCRRTHSIGEWGEGPNRVSLKQARDAHDEARAAVAGASIRLGRSSPSLSPRSRRRA
jgi:hypothetical protein